MTLPGYLREIQVEVEGYAKDYGLDFFPVIFEVLNYRQMNEVAAYGGFPTRYPHWRFGMDYESLAKGYEYGLQKIYEMVINNDPSYAYLLEGNSTVDQKIVMAHVYGHVDFFKNNYYFSKTNRKMMDGMANHAMRVRRHIERIGVEAVEEFVDTCLSLENLIDPMSLFIVRRRDNGVVAGPMEGDTSEVARLRAKPYMEDYINPPEFLESQKKKLEEQFEKKKKFPVEPTRDVLLFLIENAPLEAWERDVLEIIRAEAYYFAPQVMTKIMNEGWASYWHSMIMTQKALKASEIIDYADANAGVMATSPGQLNPYKLGVELFRHIEDRWNKGRFGKEWEECDDMAAKKDWDRRLGLGREKVFQIRKLYNDITFVDEFFTMEFCEEQKFYSFGYNERAGNYEIKSREFHKVKQQLLASLTNSGQPFVKVEEGNFENRGELLLRHVHEGVDLRIDYAQDTLASLNRVWRRPVNLLTRVENKGKVFRYDGEKHSDSSMKYDEQENGD